MAAAVRACIRSSPTPAGVLRALGDRAERDCVKWPDIYGRNRGMSEQQRSQTRALSSALGEKVPILGLGTWQARGGSAVRAVLRALEVGYRHIDTATAYGNERQVGQAVAESGVPREEIFVTTKLPPSRAGRERATLEDSLDALGFEYVDPWLIHWPPGGGARPDVWERLLELHAEGLAREVGVSNYSVRQVDELQRATGRLPAVDQIEWSPALFDRNVLAAHRRLGVQLEGYSPLRTVNYATRSSVGSQTTTASPRPRSSSAGTSSTGSSQSRSRRTRGGFHRTPPVFDFELTPSQRSSNLTGSPTHRRNSMPPLRRPPALQQLVHRGCAENRAFGHGHVAREEDERARLESAEAAVERDELLERAALVEIGVLESFPTMMPATLGEPVRAAEMQVRGRGERARADPRPRRGGPRGSGCPSPPRTTAPCSEERTGRQPTCGCSRSAGRRRGCRSSISSSVSRRGSSIR